MQGSCLTASHSVHVAGFFVNAVYLVPITSALIGASACMQAPNINWEDAQKGRFGPGGYLGITSVPLPDQRQAERSSEVERSEALAERRRREDLVQVCLSHDFIPFVISE